MNPVKQIVLRGGSIGFGALGVTTAICGTPFFLLSIPVAMLVGNSLPIEDSTDLPKNRYDGDLLEDSPADLINSAKGVVRAGLVFGVLMSPLIPSAVCFDIASKLWPSKQP